MHAPRSKPHDATGQDHADRDRHDRLHRRQKNEGKRGFLIGEPEHEDQREIAYRHHMPEPGKAGQHADDRFRPPPLRLSDEPGAHALTVLQDDDGSHGERTGENERPKGFRHTLRDIDREDRRDEEEGMADDAQQPARPEIPVGGRGVVHADEAQHRPARREQHAHHHLSKFYDQKGAEEERLAAAGAADPTDIKRRHVTDGPGGKDGGHVRRGQHGDDASPPQHAAYPRGVGENTLDALEDHPQEEKGRERDSRDDDDIAHRVPQRSHIDRGGAREHRRRLAAQPDDRGDHIHRSLDCGPCILSDLENAGRLGFRRLATGCDLLIGLAQLLDQLGAGRFVLQDPHKSIDVGPIRPSSFRMAGGLRQGRDCTNQKHEKSKQPHPLPRNRAGKTSVKSIIRSPELNHSGLKQVLIQG